MSLVYIGSFVISLECTKEWYLHECWRWFLTTVTTSYF